MSSNRILIAHNNCKNNKIDKNKLILVLLVTILSNIINCEIIFWSHNHLENIAPSPLNIFNNDYFNIMLDFLKPEKVIAFVDTENNNNTSQSYTISKLNLPKFRQLVESRISVYIPENLPIQLDNYSTVYLDGTDAEKDHQIAETYLKLLNQYNADNILAILIKQNTEQNRVRRAIKNKLPDYGPGIYYAKEKAMLYSSLYPVLRLRENDTDSEYILKKAALVTADKRDQITRLIITFSLEEAEKVVLRFRFLTTTYGYWSLNVVELQDTNHRDWTLSTSQDIVAARGFSYHCSGLTVFKNGSTTLTLTNIQVQPAPIAKQRFNDAYDCVNFTTIPIWSGLLVTAILGIALSFAIIAISNIRTMDRFDDPKGKSLTISVD